MEDGMSKTTETKEAEKIVILWTGSEELEEKLREHIQRFVIQNKDLCDATTFTTTKLPSVQAHEDVLFSGKPYLREK
jgi:hypothetical protein